MNSSASFTDLMTAIGCLGALKRTLCRAGLADGKDITDIGGLARKHFKWSKWASEQRSQKGPHPLE